MNIQYREPWFCKPPTLYRNFLSSSDTINDNNRPWKEFFSHTFIEKTDMCFYLSPPCFFLLLIYFPLLSCLFYSDTHPLHINSKRKINNLSFSLFVKKFVSYESYLPWKECFSLFYYQNSLIYWYIDTLIHINCLFTHYLLRICYCIIAYYINSTNKILIICLFHYYNEISLCIVNRIANKSPISKIAQT